MKNTTIAHKKDDNFSCMAWNFLKVELFHVELCSKAQNTIICFPAKIAFFNLS